MSLLCCAASCVNPWLWLPVHSGVWSAKPVSLWQQPRAVRAADHLHIRRRGHLWPAEQRTSLRLTTATAATALWAAAAAGAAAAGPRYSISIHLIPSRHTLCMIVTLQASRPCRMATSRRRRSSARRWQNTASAFRNVLQASRSSPVNVVHLGRLTPLWCRHNGGPEDAGAAVGTHHHAAVPLPDPRPPVPLCCQVRVLTLLTSALQHLSEGW